MRILSQSNRMPAKNRLECECSQRNNFERQHCLHYKIFELKDKCNIVNVNNSFERNNFEK